MDAHLQISAVLSAGVRKLFWIGLASVVLFGAGYAQAGAKCDDGSLSDADQYSIRSVDVDGRYLSIPLPARGTPYTKAGESRLLQAVKEVIDLEKNRESIEGATIGEITGKYALPIRLQAITTCVRVVDTNSCQGDVGQPKCVDIHVRVKTLRFSPEDPAQNILGAIPRSGTPTITDNVPSPLLVFNPRFGLEYDKNLGLSQTLEVSANLLDVPALIGRKTARVRPWRLDLTASGVKSLTRPYYDSDITLSMVRVIPNSVLARVGVRGSFESARSPIGSSDFFRNVISLGGEAYLKPATPIIKGILLEGSFSRRNNRVSGEGEASAQRTVENSALFRVLVSGQIRNDAFKLSVWGDHNKTGVPGSSYRRSAVLAGYAKDFGSGNQTFGLELLAGAGRVSGSVPDYALFRTNNRLTNFIFAGDGSRDLRNLPAGPIMRSFGSGGEPSAGGSGSYWHLNGNLSIPIPGWSRPLIPADPIDLPAGPAACPIATVRDLIKCQAGSGEVILSAIYKSKGISDHAGRAKKEFKGIRSAIGFLTDKANLFALKPLVMFDIARFGGPDGLSAVRTAAGSGLQLTLVVAKFEAGYLRTVNPQPGDSRGNFAMRLYFQNLF